MKKEIERKYKVVSGEWRNYAESKTYIRQGYLVFGPPVTVRVRLKDNEAWLTVKGDSKDGGLSRDEWEKKLTIDEAEPLFRLVRGRMIEKFRYEIPWKNHIIEVDEFISPRKGLVLAEIELASPDEVVELPSWIGEEVTGQQAYYNAYMAQNG